MELQERIQGDLAAYVDDILGSNYVFALIFGSLAYNGGTSNDVDLFILTDQELDTDTRRALQKEYFALHARYGLNPDTKYPGEYVALEELELAQKGKGFLHGGERVKIPFLYCGDDWTTENDYRHHLTATGGPTIFVSGQQEKYQEHQRRSLETLIKIVLLNHDTKSFTLDGIADLLIGPGKHFLGLVDAPGTRRYFRENIPIVLQDWSQNGTILNGSETYRIINDEPLIELDRYIRGVNSR